MPDLFDGTPDAPPDPPRPVDLMNRIVARRLGKPGWVWCRSEVVGEGDDASFILDGAVPTGVISKGPRKGRVRWPKDLERAIVSRRDYRLELLAWEAETGKCHPCHGSGRTVASVKSGPPVVTTYRGCSRCTATGRPPKP